MNSGQPPRLLLAEVPHRHLPPRILLGLDEPDAWGGEAEAAAELQAAPDAALERAAPGAFGGGGGAYPGHVSESEALKAEAAEAKREAAAAAGARRRAGACRRGTMMPRRSSPTRGGSGGAET